MSRPLRASSAAWPRSAGSSGSTSEASGSPTREDWVADAIAVLDAVGSERAAVIAPFGNSGDGIILAAQHPERVSGLIVVNGMARTMWAPDYPDGSTDEDRDPSRRLDAYEADAEELGFDVLAMRAPSVSHDPTFRSWWDRSGNLGAGPRWPTCSTATTRACELSSTGSGAAKSRRSGMASWRVSALAGPGEVVVSSTVKDLVVGSTIEFSERGEHELKGVPGAWRLYAVRH